MRPPHVWLELFVVTLVAAALQFWFVFSIEVLGTAPPPELLPLLSALFELATAVVPLVYAYHLGRRGGAGSPTTVAKRFTVVGVVVTAGLVLLLDLRRGGSVTPLWTQMLSASVRFTTTFVLAGLAGVPLGAMRAGDDEAGDAGDAVGDEVTDPIANDA